MARPPISSRPWAASLSRLEKELTSWNTPMGSSVGMAMSDPIYQFGGGFAPDLGGQIQILGLEELALAFEMVDERVRFTCREVVKDEAEKIFRESQYEVPVDTSRLKESGYVHEGTKIAALASSGADTAGAGEGGPGLATFDYGGSVGGGFKVENLTVPEYSIGYDVSNAGAWYGVYVHEIPPPPADWKPQVKHMPGDRRDRPKGKGRYRGLQHQNMQYARHTPPTKWHFLSDPFERSADRFPREMVARVAAAIATVRFTPGTLYPSKKMPNALSSGKGPARLVRKK